MNLLNCPFCGEQPTVSTAGSCINFECCHSGMSFQKSDWLTIAERETWCQDSYQFGVEAEAIALASSIGIWNTRKPPIKKSMAERHWEVARKRADDEKERADKYEDMLIKINDLVFAKGISYTGDDYWTVRGMCSEAARAKAEREKT